MAHQHHHGRGQDHCREREGYGDQRIDEDQERRQRDDDVRPLVRGGTLALWESLTAVTVTLYRQLAPLSVVRTPQT